MRPLFRDLSRNTSLMVAMVVLLMIATAGIGYGQGKVSFVQTDALSWATATSFSSEHTVLKQDQNITVMIEGRRYLLTLHPETKN